MAKKRVKYTRRRRYKKRAQRRTMRGGAMRGGAFSPEELQQLQTIGFTATQIERMNDLGVSVNDVMQKVHLLGNPSPDDLTEQIMVELLNEHIFDQPIGQAADDVHDINMDMDISFDSQGTLDMNDLNTSGISDAGYTTDEDTSFGGRRRCKTRKCKTKSKKRKTKRQRGGACIGNGVGANANEPNYSIYNTQMMSLFPYKA